MSVRKLGLISGTYLLGAINSTSPPPSPSLLRCLPYSHPPLPIYSACCRASSDYVSHQCRASELREAPTRRLSVRASRAEPAGEGKRECVCVCVCLRQIAHTTSLCVCLIFFFSITSSKSSGILKCTLNMSRWWVRACYRWLSFFCLLMGLVLRPPF